MHDHHQAQVTAAPVLSSLLDRVQKSTVGSVFDRAIALKEAGRRIIDFSTGEPDFETPEHIREAGKRAIDQGLTRYTALDGTSGLKAAIQRKFLRDNGLRFDEAEIVAAAGAKPLLAAAVLTAVEQGDEVILATPCWPSHIGMIGLAGAAATLVETKPDSGFKLTAEQLDGALTARTKLLILCSPGNPTGAVYSGEELQALSGVLRDWPKVLILSDDVYEHIVFDGQPFWTIASVAPDLSNRVMTVNGASKGYAMTGWRLGYAGGPVSWIEAIRKVFSESLGNPCSISQAAGIAALDGPQTFLADWCATYQRRRDLALAILSQAPGLKVSRPDGAFYLFPDCRALFGKKSPSGRVIGNASDFAAYLLEEFGVVVVPGSGFECDDHFRMSIATADAEVEFGARAIVRACKTLYGENKVRSMNVVLETGQAGKGAQMPAVGEKDVLTCCDGLLRAAGLGAMIEEARLDRFGESLTALRRQPNWYEQFDALYAQLEDYAAWTSPALCSAVLSDPDLARRLPELYALRAAYEADLEWDKAAQAVAGPNPRAAIRDQVDHKIESLPAAFYEALGSKRSILMAGSGPLPTTAMALADRLELPIVCLDQDHRANRLGEAYASAGGYSESVSFVTAELAECDDADRFDAIVGAFLIGVGTVPAPASARSDVVKTLLARIAADATVVLRTPQALGALVYPPIKLAASDAVRQSLYPVIPGARQPYDSTFAILKRRSDRG